VRGVEGPLRDASYPLWWDMVAVVAFSLAVYFWPLHVALPPEKIERMIDDGAAQDGPAAAYG
jgi:hypothetical protein